MLDFSTIFLDQSADLTRWRQLIKQDPDKRSHFLLMFMPLMEYVLSELSRVLQRQCPKLQSWIDEACLVKLVVMQFKNKVAPMIMRVAVLELQIASRNGLLDGDTPQARFDNFIENLQNPHNVIALLNKYTILKQQLALSVDQFCKVMQELLLRLHNDRQTLIKHFFKGNDAYQLMSISSSGDQHQQGRTVMILKFRHQTNTLRIVYKPRSLAIDVAFQHFIKWFNEHSQKLSLYTMTIFDKGDYGWSEFIEYKSCDKAEEVQQFYQRLGMWLMLTYAFRGYDVHGENVIAHGAHPVIVDYECWLSPICAFKKNSQATQTRFVVNNTGFLPIKEAGGDNAVGLDLSALGSEQGDEVLAYSMQWFDVGKDTMHAQYVPAKLPMLLNKPMLHGVTVDYLAYENEFMQGFVKAYQTILQHKSMLLSEHSPLQAFKNVKLRLIMRPTSVYSSLLFESWHPTLLYQPKQYERHFAALWQSANKSRSYKAVAKAEYRDLQQNNIPYFTVYSDGDKVFDSENNVLPIIVMKAGYDSIQRHWQRDINQSDLLIQKALIANSFSLARENRHCNDSVPITIDMQQNPLPLQELQNRALAIAKQQLDRIAKLSLEVDDIIFWLKAANIKTGEKTSYWTMTPTKIELYGGVLGIGLSYLYAGLIFQEKEYMQMANRCLQSTLAILETGYEKKLVSVGAYDGIGGVLYALAAFYRVSNDHKIKKAMHKLLKLLPSRINDDETLDILSGSAGLIVVLLSLQDILPKRTLKIHIDRCVQHILQQCSSPQTFKVLGMAHGVAGIAWALDQYYLIQPDPTVKQWIQAALAYERSALQAANTQEGVAWCYGAVGIGLARLDMSQHWQDEKISQDINLALQATLTQGLHDYACLCHGIMGNLELLLSASQQMPDPSIKQQYLQMASAVVVAMEDSRAQCSPIINSATPELMTGCAGVAYQLLRIVYPERVPSLLLLKT